jgi:hypothetical protein
MAYYEFLQSDPVMRFAMGIPDKDGVYLHEAPQLPDGSLASGDLVGNQYVADAKKWIFNDFRDIQQPVVRSAARFVNNLLLGTGTAIRNVMQIPLNTYPNVGLRNITAYFKALPRIQKAIKESLRVNARRKNLNDLEFGSAASPDVWSTKLNNLADLVRKLSLREASEQFERIYEFALGEVVAMQELGRAFKGDRHALNWVRKFGKAFPEIEAMLGKEGMSLQDVTQDTISKLAKSFTDRAAGTYDERGLPAGVMEGALAPFFAISRWSIERSNIIYKDVVRPFLQAPNMGNTQKVLGYTLGAFFTGGAIQKITELLNNSRPAEATLKEALEKGDPVAQANSVVTMMQLAAYGGIVSDIIKASVEMGSGRGLPHGISFPLIDFVSESIGKNVADYAIATKQGQDPLENLNRFVGQVLIDSVQSFRIVANNTWRADEKRRKEKFRDLRIFKELEGQPSLSVPPEFNPFMRIAEREFKQTPSAKEAVELLPEVIEQRVEESKARTGKVDIEKLRAGLKGAGITSYQVMPNPETKPAEFSRFMQYIRATQGPEAASALVSDYYQQKYLNKFKGTLIPKV